MAYLYLLVFMLGASAGSFLNLCAWRIPRQEPFIVSRSVCPRCRHILDALDLMPVLSFIFLRGTCRYCKEKISFRYLCIEMLSGVLFVAAFSAYGFTFSTLTNLVMIGILLIAALIDMEYMYIPNELVIFGILCGIILNLFAGTYERMALGFLAGGIPMLAVYLLSRGGMGAGDVKLGAVIGMFLGGEFTLLALFLGFLSGALAGVILIFAGRKGRKDTIPFAPFLAFGSIVSSLWGIRIIRYYITFSGL